MTDDALMKRIHGLLERDEFRTAWPMVSELLNENPDDPKALYFAGWILRGQGHVGMALQMFRRALAIERKVPNIWMHYGACMHDTHQYDAAIDAFQVVCKALPNDPAPLANISASYAMMGKAKDSVAWANRALAMDGNNRIARISMTFGNLALGKWEEGWKYAEVLYGDRVAIRVYTEDDEPLWDGSPGKTVVVQADQGLGDTIMFAQCLRDMVKDCKKVILETNSRLAPMFKRNFPEIDVYPTIKQDKIDWPHDYKIDARIHISYLGRYYRKSDTDFPRVPYIVADPEKVERWKAWLEQFPKPWVGLAWQGGISATNSVARSMELEDLAPVIRSGGTMISLAYQEVGLEIARWNIANREQVLVPDIDNRGDYDETLALIAALDHVVTVTTTVAHACGAMGRKAYVIVNNIPQWRYVYPVENGTGMIWYPKNSVSLYRQKPGESNWKQVVARVANDFRTYVIPLAA